jgi:hypothetical protein
MARAAAGGRVVRRGVVGERAGAVAVAIALVQVTADRFEIVPEIVNAPVPEEKARLAQVPHHSHVVRHEEDRHALFAQLANVPEALLLEEEVAHAERLVHDQDLGVERHLHREGEARAPCRSSRSSPGDPWPRRSRRISAILVEALGPPGGA